MIFLEQYTSDTIIHFNRNMELDEISKEKSCFSYSLRKEFVVE